MKILYAVQSTGNGHITRARAMAKAFKSLDIEVDWVFSGRPASELFDMQIFGNFRSYRGLTFVINEGTINYYKTFIKNNLIQFIKDIFTQDLQGYDLIINDFEPITAWAAKIKKVKSYGISHQMAFRSPIPLAGKNMIAQSVLKYFAPVSIPIGLHWDHFEASLLPPIIVPARGNSQQSDKNILVYYPFCDSQKLIDWFSPFEDYNFHIFHGKNISSGFPHIHFYSFSRSRFQQFQNRCAGVITAAGFELPSEAIQLGQKLLIMPLENQFEQQCNAHALHILKRATVIHHFSKEELQSWLIQPTFTPQTYPNVALEVAKWLVNSEKDSLEKLSKKLWSQIC